MSEVLNKINQAVILAAGRGLRLMPYTKDTPKPLMKIGNETLLERQLKQLKSAGIEYVTIHTSYLGHKIHDYIGNGDKFGLKINYAHSDELLGAGGGIVFARDYIKDPNKEFLLLNGDVFTDYNFSDLLNLDNQEFVLKLVLIDNPKHNPEGDFNLDSDTVSSKKETGLTYSGIAIIKSEFFKRENIKDIKSFLILIEPYLNDKLILGQHYNGSWDDIGTPERLDEINKNFSD